MGMTPSGTNTAARRMLGPGLSLKELNLICWGLFLGFLVAPLCVVLILQGRTASAAMQNPEVDFVYLYSMGRMLNQYPPDQLYDFPLQKKTLQEVHPLKSGAYGAIPYAPYIGVLFRSFALLPYSTAYRLWVAVSFLLYLAGVTLITALFFSDDPWRRSLVFCFALSYYPFINWTLLSGHISTIGFLAFAAVFYYEARVRPVAAGVALSICTYKPTLLVLALPMLLLSRRFRTLAGFAAGAAAIALVTTAIEGFAIWSGYLGMLFSFGRGAATVEGHSFKQLWKYVDAASFLSAIPHPLFWPVVAVSVPAGAWIAYRLLRLWWQSPKPAVLVWAATLTWTMVLNVYVPIYDSILVVLSAITTAGILRRHPSQRLRFIFTVLWLATLLASWRSLDIAEATGFQLLTVLFACLGSLQFALFRREDAA